MITSDGDLVAGNFYNLTCMVTENLTADRVITWMNSTGSPLSLGVMVEEMVVTGNTATRQLRFNPLRTSHGGGYTCTANLTFPVVSIPDVNVSTSVSLAVLSKCVSLHSVGFYRNYFIVFLCTQFHNQPSLYQATALVCSMLGPLSTSLALFN